MSAMTLHEACEAAQAIGRCRFCGHYPGEPCIWPTRDRPAGFHACRFGQAAIAGSLTAEDLTTVLLAIPGQRPAPEMVIFDTGGEPEVVSRPRMLS